MKKVLSAMYPQEIESLICDKYSSPPFRARQVREWVLKGCEPDEMQNIPTELREAIKKDYVTKALGVVHKEYEQRTDTTKLLLKTHDALLVECVVLIYDNAATVCVSTQAGCRMGCSFCTSGKNGLYRNLTCAEMLSQVLCAQRQVKMKAANIVMMGSGEPLDNYEQCMLFIRHLTDKASFDMSPRRITLSTCGIIPKIKMLCEEKIYVNLSVSLHCAISEIRAKMMPVEKAYPIREVMNAAHEYRRVSKRRITCEYCLIEGLNDTNECIKALKRLIGGTDDLINVINVNEGSDKYALNSKDAADEFAKRLKKENIDCTIRRKLGSSINAACGQLRSGYLKNSDN